MELWLWSFHFSSLAVARSIFSLNPLMCENSRSFDSLELCAFLHQKMLSSQESKIPLQQCVESFFIGLIWNFLGESFSCQRVERWFPHVRPCKSRKIADGNCVWVLQNRLSCMTENGSDPHVWLLANGIASDCNESLLNPKMIVCRSGSLRSWREEWSAMLCSVFTTDVD